MTICQLKPNKSGYQLWYKNDVFDCHVGRNDLIDAECKREGDGATPRGDFPMRGLFYRPDRIGYDQLSSITIFKPIPLEKNDGWCDFPEAPEYNQMIKLPHSARHEELWRQDGLYDVIVPLGYNDDPVIRGKGSAIFLHCTEANKPFTEGCLALDKDDLLSLLRNLTEIPIIRI